MCRSGSIQDAVREYIQCLLARVGVYRIKSRANAQCPQRTASKRRLIAKLTSTLLRTLVMQLFGMPLVALAVTLLIGTANAQDGDSCSPPGTRILLSLPCGYCLTGLPRR